MLVCSVQIISRLDSQTKKDVYTFPAAMEVHQHGVSILGSVNFCETFRRTSAVWEKCTGLKLGEVSSLFISYKITIS